MSQIHKRLKGEADQSLFKVHASNGDIVDPKEAIFPILKHYDNGVVKMLGTGFFVTRIGFFVSAKHVFQDAIDADGKQKAFLSIIQILENKTFYIRPVIGCVVHEIADIAVGICASMSHKTTGEPLLNKILALSTDLPRIGEHVSTFAYPGTTVTQSELIKTEVKFRAKFYAGKVEEYHPKGRDRVMLPFPCHRTSIILHGGSSGGPVFGENRNVIGVNSTGFDGDENISYISRIHDSLDLQIHNVVMPGTSEPTKISLRDLSKSNHVAIH